MAEYILQNGVSKEAIDSFKVLKKDIDAIAKTLKGAKLTDLVSAKDAAKIENLNLKNEKLRQSIEKTNNAIIASNQKREAAEAKAAAKRATLIMKAENEDRKRAKLIEDRAIKEQNAINKVEAAEAKAAAKRIGYINNLKIEVDEMIIKYNQMSKVELDSTQGQQFLHTLKNKREELAKLKAAYGDNTMYVGQYSRATNGMRQAMMMITGEIPNFTQSFRIGLMSLSNNWMGLSQAIAGVREEHKQMMKDFQAGLIDKKPDSVIKTITKSIFSFNLALMIVVTVLQIFQEEIGNALEGLFKFDNSLKLVRDTLKTFNESIFTKYGSDVEKLRLFAIDYNKAVREGNKDRIKQLEDVAQKEYNIHKDRLKQIAENVSNWRSAFKEYLDIAKKTYWNEALAKSKSDLEMKQALIKSQQDIIVSQISAQLSKDGFNDATISEYIDKWKKGSLSALEMFSSTNKFTSQWNKLAGEIKDVNKQVEIYNALAYQDVFSGKKTKETTGGADTTVQSGSMTKVDLKVYDKERLALQQQIAQNEIDFQELTINGEINSYDKRIQAAKDYFTNIQTLNALEIENENENLRNKYINDRDELKEKDETNKKLYDNGKISLEEYNKLHSEYLISDKNLTANFNTDILAMQFKYNKQEQDILINHKNNLLKITNDYFNEQKKLQEQKIAEANSVADKSAALAKSEGGFTGVLRGIFGVKRDSYRNSAIDENTEIIKIQNEISAQNELLKNTKFTEEQKLQIKTNITKLEEDLYKKQIDSRQKAEDKLKDISEEAQKQTVENLMAIWDVFFAYMESKIDEQLDIQKKQNDESIKNAEDKKDAGIITEKELSEFKERMSDYELSQEEEAQREKKKMERDAFLLNQAFTIGQIWMKYAEAQQAIMVASAVIDAATLGLGGTSYRIGASGWNLASAVTGTALAIAQTIPYFKDGTDSSPEGFAVLGDGFKHELGLTKDGRAFISDNKPGLYELEAGTKIFPDINKLDLLSVLNAGKGNYHFKDDSDMIKELKGIKKAVSLQKGGNFYGMPLIRQINQSDRYANRNRSLMN